MNINEVTQQLIDDPHVADKLWLADDYIIQKQRMGARFVLPSEHQLLEPIVSRYTKDLPGFLEYTKRIRDTVPPGGQVYEALQEFYRKLLMRRAQQERRERAERALAWFERKYPEASFERKRTWMRKLEQKWGRERMAYMALERRRKGERLTHDEREEVLLQFWEEVEESIKKGDLPEL